MHVSQTPWVNTVSSYCLEHTVFHAIYWYILLVPVIGGREMFGILLPFSKTEHSRGQSSTSAWNQTGPAVSRTENRSSAVCF